MTPLHTDDRGWTLYRADYRETLAAVAAAGGADLIAFSPPYCDARSYGMDVSWGDADYAALGDAVFPALKPGGHALVNVDAPVREWRPGMGTERGFHPWRLMLDWAERVGFRVPDRLVFGRLGTPGAYSGRFRNDWEPLLWFQRPGGEPWMDRWAIAEPCEPSAGPAANRRGDGSLATRERSGRAVEEGWRHRGTLWEYGHVGNAGSGSPELEAADHPARWPLRLARDIVRCFCPPGGLVVDPFVGAGTTAIAAVTEGRRFVGGDLGVRQGDGVPWVTVADRLLRGATAQGGLFTPR
jgi:site-specific DNA-methyltransferase (adenine-specific)